VYFKNHWESIKVHHQEYRDFDSKYSAIKKSLYTSVYTNNPHTIDQLKMAITEYVRNVDRAVLNTVFGNRVRRANKCLETGGGHFEHYCNFLYCNHQVHRDFLITLYIDTYNKHWTLRV
jgi:hypothetical protein